MLSKKQRVREKERKGERGGELLKDMTAKEGVMQKKRKEGEDAWIL